MQTNHPSVLPKRRTAFDEEFDIVKEMQMNRMAFRETQICLDRCAAHYMTNNFYLGEKTCMRNCFELLNQVAVVANISQAQFDEQRQRSAKR